jgi:hypothetical protein
MGCSHFVSFLLRGKRIGALNDPSITLQITPDLEAPAIKIRCRAGGHPPATLGMGEHFAGAPGLFLQLAGVDVHEAPLTNPT